PGERPWRLVTGAVLFVAGFTAVFLVIGGFVGALGSLMIQYTSAINRVSGVLVILMGLVFVGVFPRLSGEKRIRERRSEEHTSELQSRFDLVCRLLLEKKQ